MERLGHREASILALSIVASLLFGFLPIEALADEPIEGVPETEIAAPPSAEPQADIDTVFSSFSASPSIPPATIHYFIFENFLQRYGGDSGDTYQTALKIGDNRFDPSLFIVAEGGAPTVTVDFSEFGIPDPVPLFVDGPLSGTQYYAYPGRVRPVVPANATDGLKTVTASVTNVVGEVTTATYSIHIDSALPTMTVASITRANEGPLTAGSTLLLSGVIDGTGTDTRFYDIRQKEFDSTGYAVRDFEVSGLAGNEALRALGAGAFTDIPVVLQSQVGNGALHADTVSVSFSFLAIDEAGNQVRYETNAIPVAGEVIPPTPSVSNVLFLPGIKGSRLYGDDGNKLWLPGSNDDVQELFLNVLGKSQRDDIHVRKNDILAQVEIPLFPFRIYQSFVEKMNGLQASGAMTAWEAVPYDWRLSLPDIISGGVERDGKIYYTEPTDAPYIEATLRGLAATSKTGKVTLIAHSNGGLVAKALMQKIGDAETAALIDEIVFVGVPQSGAPQALGALLYGHKEDLPLIASAATSRELALNSPMAYHLLPTDSYLMSESESVAHFEGNRAYGSEIAAYGATIDSWHELSSFVQASEGGRVRPDSNNLDRAGIGNPTLLSYAQNIHDEIDTWQPPAGVTLHQVAGWGVDTFVGVKLQEFSLPWFDTVQEYYTPLFAKRGDEVVPASSSLLIEASDNSNRYWIDLDKLEDRAGTDYAHANLFEIDSVITLINSILFNGPDVALPDNFYTSEPAIDETQSWFRFFLHSPLTLEVFDADGNRVGLNEDGTIDSEIEDGAYETFGDVQFITVPAGGEYRVVLNGYADGMFVLEAQELRGEEIQGQITFGGVPTTEDTMAVFEVTGELSEETFLSVDIDGDGTEDAHLASQLSQETVYQPSTPAEETESEPSGSSGGVTRSPDGGSLAESAAQLTIPTTVTSLDTLVIKLADVGVSLDALPQTQGEVLGIENQIPESGSEDSQSQQHWLSVAINWVYTFVMGVISKLASFFKSLYAG